MNLIGCLHQGQEYRILLRQDDADVRLTEKGYNIRSSKTERIALLNEKKEEVQKDNKLRG